MQSADEPLSINMKSATALLEVFLIAISLAFSVTIMTGTGEMRLLALATVMPITILALVFIHHRKLRRIWGYAGASILGFWG
jgi:hypothetical protein